MSDDTNATPHTMTDDATYPWQDWLEQGNASTALRTYLERGGGSMETENGLRDLVSMQRALRGKQWQRAKDELSGGSEDVPNKDTLTLTALVDRISLKKGVEMLEASNELLEQRKPDEALAQLESIDLPLLMAEVATQRGTAYIFQGELEDAKRAFEDALERDPNHYRALTNLGNVALEQNKTDDAIGYYQAALRINENFSNAHHNLGVAYRRNGEIGKSVQAIRKAQRAMQQEDMTTARQTMAQSQRKYGKWILYGVGAVVVYLILRARGVL
ncbi:MAG: tetratricopeptide repeat protein [Deinococcota bacterium]